MYTASESTIVSMYIKYFLNTSHNCMFLNNKSVASFGITCFCAGYTFGKDNHKTQK